jgi:drug/metabolite transporter (DMT)-like permease
MFQSHLGEIIALGTAVCWTATSLSFQKATSRVGSLPVNILRLLLALVIYCVVSKFIRGSFLPLDASAHIWIWMTLSGLVGFVFGDFFLFKSYETVSARISMLVMSLSPPIAAFISWLALGETLTIMSMVAMLITLLGIVIVITERKEHTPENNEKKNKLKIKYPVRGLIFAFGGALGQAGGIVISKYGMANYSVFAATQIRIIAGSVGFFILVFLMRQWGQFFVAVKDKKTMLFITIGAIFGPFIGVYFSLLSVKYTSVGIASTIMAIVPILIIPPAIIFLKEKVTVKEIIGSIITVGGVALFFV